MGPDLLLVAGPLLLSTVCPPPLIHDVYVHHDCHRWIGKAREKVANDRGGIVDLPAGPIRGGLLCVQMFAALPCSRPSLSGQRS